MDFVSLTLAYDLLLITYMKLGEFMKRLIILSLLLGSFSAFSAKKEMCYRLASMMPKDNAAGLALFEKLESDVLEVGTDVVKVNTTIDGPQAQSLFNKFGKNRKVVKSLGDLLLDNDGSSNKTITYTHPEVNLAC